MNGQKFFESISKGSGILSLVAVVGLGVVVLTSNAGAADPAAQNEWVLPGAFTGQGAVTLGCQLWDVPAVTPYSSLNPNTGFAAGSFSPVSFLAIVDGPHGSVALSGEACGISIDWRRFPSADRPMD